MPQRNPHFSPTGRVILVCLLASWFTPCAHAQVPGEQSGQAIPRDVRELYDRGIDYLIKTQSETGDWNNTNGEQGPGVTGLCLMVLLASGEDPNFGLYSSHVRRAVRALIKAQDPTTGYMGPSMYHHGFAMLALAEAYGTVDDRHLWQAGEEQRGRSIAAALELAVRAAVTSQQKNPTRAWRYSPDATDADTSVSGAVLVGLLAARNAGIEVPDQSIDQAIAFFQSLTADTGQVAYAQALGGFDESLARISIACLVYSIARRKDLPQFNATLKYLTGRLEQPGQEHYRDYTRYYQAQALLQGDPVAWSKWNSLLVRQLKASQQPDGSFTGSQGPIVSTSLSLLALAVNYRFLPIYER